MASACSRLGRRRAQARMLRAGRAETRGARGGQPASACLWGGAACARAQKGQRGPAESWRGAVRRAEVGARRGRGGWTRVWGCHCHGALTGGTDVLREGGTGCARCLGRCGLRGSRVYCCVRDVGPRVRPLWTGPAFFDRRCLLWALCRGKELPLCQPSLGALSAPAE